MNVEAILKRKGGRVVTVDPETTIAVAAQRLNLDHIGAMVVMRGREIAGILSERDIITGLAHHGAAALERKVGDLMSHPVVTCTRQHDVKQIMAIMTQRRIRHLPVVEDGKLIGIVSIGDVVRYRLEELELETNVLRDVFIART